VFQNVLSDPGFETSDGLSFPGWQFIFDLCDVQGASFNAVLGNVRSGLKSLRLNARFRAIGPTTTCGGVLQNLSGLTPFVPYVGGVWWKSSGVFPGVQAFFQVENSILATIAGNTGSVWRFQGGLFYPQSSSAVCYIVQTPGTTNFAQARYFDDAIFVRVEDLGNAEMIAQALSADLFDPAALGVTQSGLMLRSAITAPFVVGAEPSVQGAPRSRVAPLSLSGGVDPSPSKRATLAALLTLAGDLDPDPAKRLKVTVESKSLETAIASLAARGIISKP